LTEISDGQLARAARQIAEHNPDVWQAYEQLGKAGVEAGPLDARTVHLVKIAAAVAQRSQRATHAHVRQALEAKRSAMSACCRPRHPAFRKPSPGTPGSRTCCARRAARTASTQAEPARIAGATLTA
jgi:hypothetical protein